MRIYMFVFPVCMELEASLNINNTSAHERYPSLGRHFHFCFILYRDVLLFVSENVFFDKMRIGLHVLC